MSAIEMMDPKMDAGMAYITEKDQVKSFKQAYKVRTKFDKIILRLFTIKLIFSEWSFKNQRFYT